jgi:hypothetical protein
MDLSRGRHIRTITENAYKIDLNRNIKASDKIRQKDKYAFQYAD